MVWKTFYKFTKELNNIFFQTETVTWQAKIGARNVATTSASGLAWTPSGCWRKTRRGSVSGTSTRRRATSKSGKTIRTGATTSCTSPRKPKISWKKILARQIALKGFKYYFQQVFYRAIFASIIYHFIMIIIGRLKLWLARDESNKPNRLELWGKWLISSIIGISGQSYETWNVLL